MGIDQHDADQYRLRQAYSLVKFLNPYLLSGEGWDGKHEEYLAMFRVALNVMRTRAGELGLYELSEVWAADADLGPTPTIPVPSSVFHAFMGDQAESN